MAQGTRNGKRKRAVSKRQQAVYRRRRIVVGIGLLLALALAIFCVYSIVRGVGEIGPAISRATASHAALGRDSAPEPKRTTGVKNCASSDTRLELSAQAASVAVGGSLQWTETITHEGTDSCLIDDSDSSLVLTITSGDETVWRSDLCPVDGTQLLMASGDRKVRTVTWNTNRTGTECADDATLPKVDRGTYVARLTLKNDSKAQSPPVTIEVQ
ncbi:hypothetical protein [Bifidobacterium panos]|uniref:Peptide ABC transporter permease n=1 Tax=Bifidobacterium panos TaxID=2675321 RepID=A0ABX1SYW1_9BIFI|nr:hypothetical protein [Bifidobacterium sp. DSM 109963]NMN02002.1 hypothetical protein [Bifidobacterium sp. DSM 109963]